MGKKKNNNNSNNQGGGQQQKAAAATAPPPPAAEQPSAPPPAADPTPVADASVEAPIQVTPAAPAAEEKDVDSLSLEEVSVASTTWPHAV